MSAIASAAQAPANSQPSTQRRVSSRADAPRRAPSMATSDSSASNIPYRSNSSSQMPSVSRQTNLTHVARNDHEQTDLPDPRDSKGGSPKGRLTSDRSPPRYGDVPRLQHRTTSRSERSGNTDDTRLAHTATNGTAAESVARSAASAPKRRTNIHTSTGNWILGKTIGQGSMGKVKLAKNYETGEQVAIKIVPRQSTDEHRSQQDRERADHSKEVRTAREAAIVTLVNHPYICGMRDVVRTHHHWYMLFEYVNGGQMLDYIISHGRLKEKQARKFGRQIASALDYCHRNSIVHRDLKIENILISKTGDIKIIDFGLSNLFSPHSQLKTFCGSLYFAAPELLQAKQYTGPEVDIWSFGIVLYVLVCGKVPFDDQSMPQLHAKIKKGIVEYPPWLSAECRNIISRMLVTDPRNRAGLAEIMTHPWMTKGFNGAPDNFLPHREPLREPLDRSVIDKMTGFDFGSSDFILRQLDTVLSSEEYQRAVRSAARRQTAHTHESDRKSRGMFDFYQRRKSANSKDALTNSSAEGLALGEDPVNAFSPFVSVYYLVREKMDRERTETNPGALSIPQTASEKHSSTSEIMPPQAAYTNPASYEIAGEAPTGGRARPRARTHGEDDAPDEVAKARESKVPTVTTTPARNDTTPSKRENVAVGLFRRFSARRTKESEREKPPVPSPTIASESSHEPSGASPLKSFTMRKPKDRDNPPSAYANIASNHRDLLAPPDAEGPDGRKTRGLGRSTSMNAADFRSRWTRRGASEGPSPQPSFGELEKVQSEGAEVEDVPESDSATPIRPRAAASRAKSLGHAARENIQARRALREQSREEDLPEETDQDLLDDDTTAEASRSGDTMKPVYLKGLFSVSTTSNKPIQVIRSDIIRVLRQLGVEYREIRGGFSCRNMPSADLKKTAEAGTGLGTTDRSPAPTRRKISFASARTAEREELLEQQRQAAAQKGGSRKAGHEGASISNSDESDDEPAASAREPRAAGETTTQVQSDMGQSVALRFEILVVKVPFLSLHGLQFKKVDGGTWQYKKMAETILAELNL